MNIKGNAKINNLECEQGDGLAIENEDTLSIKSSESEIILFDLK